MADNNKLESQFSIEYVDVGNVDPSLADEEELFQNSANFGLTDPTATENEELGIKIESNDLKNEIWTSHDNPKKHESTSSNEEPDERNAYVISCLQIKLEPGSPKTEITSDGGIEKKIKSGDPDANISESNKTLTELVPVKESQKNYKSKSKIKKKLLKKKHKENGKRKGSKLRKESDRPRKEKRVRICYGDDSENKEVVEKVTAADGRTIEYLKKKIIIKVKEIKKLDVYTSRQKKRIEFLTEQISKFSGNNG